MNKLNKIIISSVLLLTFFVLMTKDVYAADKRSYILSTATTGGTFYPVGVAISTLTKLKLEKTHGFSISAISSAGSGENVKLLREDQAQFAILQGLYAAWAWNGEGKVKNSGPQTNLRSITMLWQNVEQMVVNKRHVKTGSVIDLKSMVGNKFSIGKRNSGTEGSGRHILNALGIDIDKSFNVVFLGYGPSADAIQNRSIAGMNTPGGVPISAVTRAFASAGGQLQILNFSEDDLKVVNKKYDLWSPYVIKAGTYPDQKQDVQTIAQPNLLVTRKDISAEDVYQLTKAIYENLGFLNNIHAATKAMSIEKSVVGLPIPLHEGALKFYKQNNVRIPSQLVIE